MHSNGYCSAIYYSYFTHSLFIPYHNTAKLNNPPDSSIPKLREVFVGLVKNLQARWYEIFLNLGIHRNVLDKCLENHPFDDHSALIEMIAVWLQRSDPLPSWRCLVDVIQNTLLEGKVALEIKRKYCRELLQESEGNVHSYVHVLCF